MQKTTVFFHFLISVLVTTSVYSLEAPCPSSPYTFLSAVDGGGGHVACATFDDSNDYNWDSGNQECRVTVYDSGPSDNPAYSDPSWCQVYYTNTLYKLVSSCSDGYEADVDGICQEIPPPVCVLPQVLDSNNTCQNDDDGDGIPNTDDDDIDGDGILNVDDYDDDNDGESDAYEIANGTDPSDSGSNTNGGTSPSECSSTCGIDNAGICQDEVSYGSLATPIAIVDYQPCNDCTNRISQEFYGMTCNQFFGEIEDIEEPIIDSCSHDTIRDGFPFQEITISSTQCTALIYANAKSGVGRKQTLNNCSQGTTACFYLPIDNSSSEEDNKTADINQTSTGDLIIVDKLEEIIEINEGLGLGLNTIDDSINSQTDKLSSKFDMLATSNKDGSFSIVDAVNGSGDGIKISVDGVKASVDGLGSKLDGIQGAINAKEEYAMESESNLEFDDVEVDGMTSGYSADVSSQFSTFTNTFEDDLFTLQSITLPVSPNCGCIDPVIDLNMMGHNFNQTVEVCSSLDSLFAVMRPLLWFSFLTSLLFGFFRKD